jgi:hypothetical protein
MDDLSLTACDTTDELKEVADGIAEIAREVASEYQESIEAMPQALQYSSPSAEEMNEKIYALEAYADELECFDPQEDSEDDEDEDFDPLEDARSELENVVSGFDY